MACPCSRPRPSLPSEKPTTTGRCDGPVHAPGVPRIDTSNSGDALHPFEIVRTPSLAVLLLRTSSNSIFRQVFLDGRPLPADPQQAWLGYSVGKWEGDTLVVDAIGFNLTAPGSTPSKRASANRRGARHRTFHPRFRAHGTSDPRGPQSLQPPLDRQAALHPAGRYGTQSRLCENEKDIGHSSIIDLEAGPPSSYSAVHSREFMTKKMLSVLLDDVRIARSQRLRLPRRRRYFPSLVMSSLVSFLSSSLLPLGVRKFCFVARVSQK